MAMALAVMWLGLIKVHGAQDLVQLLHEGHGPAGIPRPLVVVPDVVPL